MKKHIGIIILALTAATAFGADFSFSAGAGGILNGIFTRYTLSADGVKDGNRIKINAGQEMNQLNYGYFIFFDATYGVFGVFHQGGRNKWHEPVSFSDTESSEMDGDGWESVLGLSLLGKYPFALAKKLIVFPMLGMDFEICLKQQRTDDIKRVYDRPVRDTDKDGNPLLLSDWNSFMVKVGGGLDFMLFSNIFLRSEFLYSFRLMTSYERKNLDMIKSISGDSKPKLGGLTSGPSVRISAGYRFL